MKTIEQIQDNIDKLQQEIYWTETFLENVRKVQLDLDTLIIDMRMTKEKTRR
jgi:hypothetical protein